MYISFHSYAFFHATRKTFSNVKSTISSEWSATPGNSTLVNKPDAVSIVRDNLDYIGLTLTVEIGQLKQFPFIYIPVYTFL